MILLGDGRPAIRTIGHKPDVPEDAQSIQAKGEFVKGGRVAAMLGMSGAPRLNEMSDDIVSPHGT
jgi:hypothetical protein